MTAAQLAPAVWNIDCADLIAAIEDAVAQASCTNAMAGMIAGER